METFKREISFLSISPDADGGASFKPVIKTVTFKELSQTDKDQHKLHFSIIKLMSASSSETSNAIGQEEKTTLDINTDVLYDLTTKFVKTMVVFDEDFKEMPDLKELLQDSGALLNLSMWLLTNKFIPFFQKLMGS